MGRSYLKQEEETRKTLDEEGWIHTGEPGRVDEDGFVYITGRLKELIVTSGGENVSPVPIENRLMELCPEISNAIVIGDKRNYLSCLICLKTEMDPVSGEPLPQLSKKVVEKSKKIGSSAVTCEEASVDPLWHNYVGKAIEEYNEKVRCQQRTAYSQVGYSEDGHLAWQGRVDRDDEDEASVVVRNYAKRLTASITLTSLCCMFV